MKIGTLIGRNLKGGTVKSIICKIPNGTAVVLEMKTVEQIIRDKGLDEHGDAQMYHTHNVLNRLARYMPYATGVTYKVTQLQTDIRIPEIVTDTRYAKYLFYGEKLIDPKINASGFLTPEGWRSRIGCVKVRSGKPLEYHGKNKNAGPRWDRALSAAEGQAMAEDLQRYLARR